MKNASTNTFNTSESKVLDSINVMSTKASEVREKCNTFRSLLDEGSYKIDAILNIVDKLKTQEMDIVQAGGDATVKQQITEEQIDSFLEMLKTPTFQHLIKQMLHKWAT
jgi:precorrin-6B methylase 2